jgi:hypothetical protein
MIFLHEQIVTVSTNRAFMPRVKHFFSYQLTDIVLAIVFGYSLYWIATQKQYIITSSQIITALICILTLCLAFYAIYQFTKFFFETSYISRSKRAIRKETKLLVEYIIHSQDRVSYLRSEIEKRYLVLPFKSEYNLKFIENILVHLKRRLLEIDSLLDKKSSGYFHKVEDLFHNPIDLNGNSFENLNTSLPQPKVSLRTARTTISNLLLSLEDEVNRNKPYHHKINA